jgi:hypothetical protein
MAGWKFALAVLGFFAAVATIEYLVTGGILIQSWHTWRP